VCLCVSVCRCGCGCGCGFCDQAGLCCVCDTHTFWLKRVTSSCVCGQCMYACVYVSKPYVLLQYLRLRNRCTRACIHAVSKNIYSLFPRAITMCVCLCVCVCVCVCVCLFVCVCLYSLYQGAVTAGKRAGHNAGGTNVAREGAGRARRASRRQCPAACQVCVRICMVRLNPY
jgi:hypothetical protein